MKSLINYQTDRLINYQTPNLPLQVGFAESHMVMRSSSRKYALKQLGETLTVVLEQFVGFPIQRESHNSAV